MIEALCSHSYVHDMSVLFQRSSCKRDLNTPLVSLCWLMGWTQFARFFFSWSFFFFFNINLFFNNSNFFFWSGRKAKLPWFMSLYMCKYLRKVLSLLLLSVALIQVLPKWNNGNPQAVTLNSTAGRGKANACAWLAIETQTILRTALVWYVND